MAYVETLFLPVKATATPQPSSDFAAGDDVTIDTNVPAFILYTTDGSLPEEGEFGTTKADAPVTIRIVTTTTLRFKAIDNRLEKGFNQTKTQKLTYTVTRNNPAEAFRDNKHFFKKIEDVIVDHNFYIGGDWAVPASENRYSYLYKNEEGFKTRVRLLHNGIDSVQITDNNYPQLNAGETIEFYFPSRSGDNSIEIQTSKVTS